MTDIAITRAGLDQLETIQDLAMTTFRETFGHDNTEEQLQEFFDEAYTLEVLGQELKADDSETYLVSVDGEIAGFLKVNWGESQTEKELDDSFEVQRIYGLPRFQGQGLGKRLFTFALERANELGFTWAWLGVWEHNTKAQALYKKYGFEKFSEHQFAVGDKVDTDWLMRKYLK